MPEHTLVFQSHREVALDGWIGLCINSVKQWAQNAGYDYLFHGDGFFNPIDPFWL